MSPPQLPTYAPIANVVHPVEIHLGEAIRNDLCVAVCHGVSRRLSERLHLDVPLAGDNRLDDAVTPITVTDRMLIRLHLLKQSFVFQLHHNVPARLIHALPFIGPCIVIQRAVKVHYVDRRKSVALANLEVRRIMTWCDLQRTRAESKLDRFISNYGQLPSKNWQYYTTADVAGISLILWIYRYGGVSKQRLRTSGCHNQCTVSIFEVIADMIKVAALFAVLNFKIGKCSATSRTPVSYALALINETLLVEVYECGPHSRTWALVKCECCAGPVAGCAYALRLLINPAAVSVHPLPHALVELVAPKVVTCNPFAC